MRTVAAFTWVALLVTGCTHLDIAPLPASPSPEQRLATWQGLHATIEETITSCSRRDGCSTANILHLANGGETPFPEDLLPVVAPDSETARHARRAAHHRSVEHVLTAIGGVILVGLAVTLFSDIGHDDANESQAAHWIDAGSLVALLGLGSADYWHAHKAGRESRAAFASYNKDLGENLRICLYNDGAVPCEQVSPGGAPGEYIPPVTLRAPASPSAAPPRSPLAPTAHASLAMRAR